MNSSSPLFVIAEQSTVTMWQVIGANGVVYSQNTSEVLNQLNQIYPEVKAALIGEKVYREATSIIRFLNEKQIPWIILLDSSNDYKIGYQELKKLSEKAIGMPIKIN